MAIERNAKDEMDSLKKTIEVLKNIHEQNIKNPVLAQYEKGYLDALSNIEMTIAAIETQTMIVENINQFWSLFGFGQDKS
jgi:hypothetical protein